MTTAAAGGRGANTATESRKANFNVLLDDDNTVAEETVAVASSSGKKEEESLEQLLAAAVVSPSSTAEDSMWATATSKHPHTKKRPAYQPRPVVAGAGAVGVTTPTSPSTSTAAHSTGHQTHQTQSTNPPTREPVNLSEDTTLEFYEFPAAFRTPDLKAALERFQQGRYRLKWNNDTSCWFVFDGVESRDAALKVVLAYIEERDEESKFKVRIYKPEYYPEAVAGAGAGAGAEPTA